MKTIALAITVLVIVVLVFRSISKQRTREQQYWAAFESVFSSLPATPKYEQRYSYGYPAFTVTFASKPDLDENRTNGLTERFTKRIGELCKDSGSKKHPFDAERAIWFTYEGEIDEIVARSQITRD